MQGFATISSVLRPLALPAAKHVCTFRISYQYAMKRQNITQVRFVSMNASDDSGVSKDTVISIVERKLTAALQPQKLEVIPIYGDPNGSHISINVVSSMFAGKRMMQRHQLVYKAIWDELQGPIHAVDAIDAKTPEEL